MFGTRTFFFCIWLGMMAGPTIASSTETPIPLRCGPHLLIDDYLIADQTNLTRSINHPARLPEPVVTGKEDKNFQPYMTVLRDDLPADPGGKVAGIGYTVLAWSHDGKHWQRDRAPFLDRNQKANTWDHAMTWGDCQLIVDDETYIYYGGYARGHKIERFTERQIGLARMPLDRYVARKAGADRAVLTTPLVQLEGDAMTVNAKVDGRIKVRLLDQTGEPLPHFDYGDCKPIRGDSIRHPVKWGDSLAVLRHKPVRLQFDLRKASLYGFNLLNTSADRKLVTVPPFFQDRVNLLTVVSAIDSKREIRKQVCSVLCNLVQTGNGYENRKRNNRKDGEL